MSRGKYIVIEGTEGVGKTTHVQELARRMRIAGLDVRVLREPDSQSDLTARAIRQLTQDPNYPMNTRTEVLLYNAARAQSLQNIKESIESGVNCIVDRNYLTTLAIQYYGRGDVPDYDIINTIINFAVGDIEPDVCIVLDAPVQILHERLKNRYSGDRFDDLDDSFLERVRAGYLWEAKQRNFPVIYSTDDLDSVADSIWSIVSNNLSTIHSPSQQSIEPTPIATILANKQLPPVNEQENTEKIDHSKDNIKYVIKNDGKTTITADGKEYLQTIITNSEDNIYAFNDELSATTVAAAMARLSRRGDDMRITLLDEFTNNKGKDEGLLERVITAYGDDSVQQLAGLHFVIENASNLLTKKIEWGRLASYLEQSTRYIYYDEKDNSGNYKYFVPKLNEEIKTKCVTALDSIFDIYSSVVHKLTEHIQNNSNVPANERDGAWRAATRAQACDAARSLLPVATKSTVGIYASGQALESLIMRLQADENIEAQISGNKLLKEARKIMPVFLQRADKPERGGATVAYYSNTKSAVKNLSKEMLKSTHSTSVNDDVQLVDYWPKNEMLLVPDMIYEHSNLSINDLKEAVNLWSYDQRLEIFNTYIGERLNRRHKPGRALEKAHYSWDIICDYGIFRDLQRHRMVDDLAWQELTPRYGFDIPELIEEANLIDEFENAFEISLKIHSEMIAAGYSDEAQYTTLLGHKMRWKITYNAREAFHLHELRTTPQGHPSYRKLVLKMHEKLAEVHPLLAESMKFVNQDEDPELTRLAAERYTQYKLQKLK